VSTQLYAEIEELLPRLRAYARVLVKNGDGADDLVQTCLERAISRIEQFQPGTNLKAWLYTIMRNAHINDLRRQSRWAHSIDSHDCEELFAREGNQIDSMRLRELLEVFEGLPERDRSVLRLVGMEGMTYEEAGQIMGVPVGTVRSRLSRARGKLRDSLLQTDLPALQQQLTASGMASRG
jgi:RNA polymerase sigma-70 factor (ECF subfamily)